ncbi:MAG: hypothetical protein ABJF10_10260 [Chthoniobacter sp.]|uniref:hypothetical protein n=1 Tax=Chthoniobacter sp. TaxID=2510640 RepID=UPI0032AB0EB5
MPSKAVKTLIAEGRAILSDYHNHFIHTKELENVLLEMFETKNKQLTRLQGQKSKWNIIAHDVDYPNLRRLPPTLTIYRGSREPEKRVGISWSLDRRIAERFAYKAQVAKRRILIARISDRNFYANGYTDEEIQRLIPTVLTGTCSLTDVLAYTNILNEQEIVINPLHVTIIKEDNSVRDAMKQEVDSQKVPMALPLDALLATMQPD